ncbi:MAG: response regulator transcription factor [Dehalococcoidia bacterium]
MAKTRILVVDDEISILKFVSASLRSAGYEPSLALDGQEALKAIEETLPDLVILDITMPKLDGFEVCRRVRQWSQVPIIMLSARGSEQDKVECLRIGADDYLVKPFAIEELLARVEAVLRRTRAAEAPSVEPTFVSHDLQVNFAERRVTVGGREVNLTATEYSLLRELILNRGKVLTHRMLLNRVWGPEYGDERDYVRVFVGRLRHKLGDDAASPKYIRTESGVGYRFLNSP